MGDGRHPRLRWVECIGDRVSKTYGGKPYFKTAKNLAAMLIGEIVDTAKPCSDKSNAVVAASGWIIEATKCDVEVVSSGEGKELETIIPTKVGVVPMELQEFERKSKEHVAVLAVVDTDRVRVDAEER